MHEIIRIRDELEESGDDEEDMDGNDEVEDDVVLVTFECIINDGCSFVA